MGSQALRQRGPLLLRHQVQLVQNHDHGFVPRAQFREHFQRGFVVAHGFRIGRVHHLNQEIRQNGFFQR